MMKKLLILIFLICLSNFSFPHSYYFTDEFAPSKKRNLSVANALKFFIDSRINTFNNISKISPKYWKSFKDNKSINITFAAKIKFNPRLVEIKLSISQSGTSDILIRGKPGKIDALIINVLKKIKVYIGYRNKTKAKLNINYKSFSLIGRAISLPDNRIISKLKLALIAHRISPTSPEILSYIVDNYFKLKEYIKAKFYLDKLLHISIKQKFDYYINYSRFLIAKYYFHNLDFRRSRKILNSCIDFFKNNNKYIRYFWSGLLLIKIFRYTHEFQNIMNIINKIKKLTKIPFQDSFINNELGAIKLENKQLSMAKNYFQKSFVFFNKYKFKYYLAKTLANLISIKVISGQTKKLKKDIIKMAKYSKNNNKLLYIKNYIQAELLYRQKKLSQALKYYSAADYYASKSKYLYGIILSKYMLGKIYYLLKNYRKSLSIYNIILPKLRGTLLDKVYGWSLFYTHLCYYELKNITRSIPFLKRSIDILGFINPPALKLLNKRLEQIRKNKPVDKLNHNPEIIKEMKKKSKKKKENKKMSRREKALKKINNDKKLNPGGVIKK